MSPIRETVGEWLRSWKFWLAVLGMVGSGVVAASGTVQKLMEMPERLKGHQSEFQEHRDSFRKHKGRFDRWIMYQNLDRCERDGIPPTECDPREIPEPGSE